jgi:hypothetical protein
VVQDYSHKALLRFVRKIVDVPVGYSKQDLIIFRNLASTEYPSLVPLIDAYLLLAERADTEVQLQAHALGQKATKRKTEPRQMHLFDLLRDRRLFPQNSDLSDFAVRILPNMTRRRFDKMSRGDIAARIIEYLESRDPRTRESLETSMREAMTSGTDSKLPDKRSFLTKWERIIKGLEP